MRVATATALALGASLLLGAASAPDPAAAAAGFPDSAAIVRELRAFVEDYRGAPGVVAGVIDSGGRRVLAFGQSGRRERPQLDGATRFEIGSITKTFTGLLLAEMVRAGEVSADERLVALLPADLAPANGLEAVTLEQLATHTSGLPRIALDPRALSRVLSVDPYRGSTARDVMLSASHARLSRGGNLAYSNLGFALLGRLLEVRAGQPYEALLRRRILEPRGLGGIATAHDARPDPALALGHGAGGRPAHDWHLDGYAPAGSLIASADELLDYLAIYIAGRDSAAVEACRLRRTFPDGDGIGLAWMHTKIRGRRLIWHNGGTGGFRTFAGFLPDEGKGVVVLANGMGNVDALALRLLDPTRRKLPTHRPSAGAIATTLVLLAWGPLLMAISLRLAARVAPPAPVPVISAPAALDAAAHDPRPRSRIDRLDVLRRPLMPAIALVLAERLGAWRDLPFILWWGSLALVFATYGMLLVRTPALPWLRGGAWSAAGSVLGTALEAGVLAALLS